MFAGRTKLSVGLRVGTLFLSATDMAAVEAVAAEGQIFGDEVH
jgi:hypothetical protein